MENLPKVTVEEYAKAGYDPRDYSKRSDIDPVSSAEEVKAAIDKWIAAHGDTPRSATGTVATQPATPKPTAPKFYHTMTANRHVRAGKFSLRFLPYEQAGGMFLGCYMTTNTEEIVELDKLVADKKHGISTLTQKEYEVCTKKKVANSNTFGTSLVERPEVPAAPANQPARAAENLLGAALNAEPAAENQPGTEIADKPADALRVGKVE